MHAFPWITIVFRVSLVVLLGLALPGQGWGLGLGHSVAQRIDPVIDPSSRVLSQWEGMSQTTTIRPPDPHGAAGPSGVLAVVNLRVCYFNKSGGSLWGPVGFGSFFAPTGNSGEAFNADPHALYDLAARRFYVVLQENNGTNSFFNVAVSKNPHPATATSADWYFYRIEVTESVDGIHYGADYPGVGWDGQALYITANMFSLPFATGGAFKNCQVISINKADALSGTMTFRRVFTPDGVNEGFTLQPASVLAGTTPGQVMYFGETPLHTTTSVRMWALTDPLGSGVLTNRLVPVPDHGGYVVEGAPQPGTATRLPTLSPRTQGNGFWLNGGLWFCHTAGGSTNRSRVYFYKVNSNGFPAGSPVLEETGVIDGGPETWTFQPAIGGQTNGGVCLVYCLSSPTHFPTIMAVSRSGGVTNFNAPLLIKASPTHAEVDRWGDFATVSPDPTDDGFWVCHEWVRSSALFEWSTWWAKVVPELQPLIRTNGLRWMAESCPPANGVVDPGEQVTFGLTLRNVGPAATTALSVSLLPGYGVHAPGAPQSYGVLHPTQPGQERFFTFTGTGSCGGQILATFQLQDGEKLLEPLVIPLPVGQVSSLPITWSASAPVAIPDFGPATPYPASLQIQEHRVMGRVSVTLRGLTHTFPNDLQVLLVGPQDQRIMLLSQVGGGYPVSNLQLTFSDEAPATLPVGGPLTSGSYRPSFPSGLALPAPAPAFPYLTNLGALVGASTLGVWNLYVYDGVGRDSGSLEAGWELSVNEALCCASCLITAIELLENGAKITFLSLPGQPHQLERSQVLTDFPPAWSPVGASLSGTGGLLQVTETNAMPQAQAFYRVRVLP